MAEAAREQLLADLSADYRAADLDAADRAMLDYAMKLTREPWAVAADGAFAALPAV